MSFKISLYLQTQLWSHSIVSREKTFSALIKNAAWPSQSLNAVMVRNSYGAIRLGLEAEGQWIWHASLPAALEGVSDLRDASVCMAAGLFSRAPSRVLAAMLVLSTALSFGPGGFVARMSRTESAICLLARLTRSPQGSAWTVCCPGQRIGRSLASSWQAGTPQAARTRQAAACPGRTAGP